MKQITSYISAVGYLNKLFDLLSERFFGNELVRPTITIQSTPKAYGHFTLRSDTWKSITGDSFEINIGAGTLGRPIELTATTLYHEMIHMYCATHNLQDTSNNHAYHNRIFKREAEAHGGALVSRDPRGRYGWTVTHPSEEMRSFIQEHNLSDIMISRNEGLVPFSSAKTHSRKYTCPCCGNSVRATKAVNVACMDCDEIMNCNY